MVVIVYDEALMDTPDHQHCDGPYGCSVEATLAVIGGRWKPVIIFLLLQHEVLRFGELKKTIEGITQRMLTNQLRELERDNIINRTVYAEVPPKVEYALTDYGRTLEPIMITMRDWGYHHLRKNDTTSCKQMRPDMDVIGYIASKRVLFVGEGNMSFARSISTDKRIHPEHMTVSTFEPFHELTDIAKENAVYLKNLGTTVLHGIDATQLDHVFKDKQFDRIIFQFPHTGSRAPVNGRNPNHILIKDFLAAAAGYSTDARNCPHFSGGQPTLPRCVRF